MVLNRCLLKEHGKKDRDVQKASVKTWKGGIETVTLRKYLTEEAEENTAVLYKSQ